MIGFKSPTEEIDKRQAYSYNQTMTAGWDKKYPYKAEARGVRPENIPGKHASIPFGSSWARKRKFWFQTWTERDVFCKEWDGTPIN